VTLHPTGVAHAPLSLSLSLSLSHTHAHTLSFANTHTHSLAQASVDGKEWHQVALHPALYTLHPSPCTLHPIHSSLNTPTPHTQNLASYTLHPYTHTPIHPYTLQPSPHTIHPTPKSRNPKPETLHQKPETRDPKPETQNPKPENPKSETRIPDTCTLHQVQCGRTFKANQDKNSKVPTHPPSDTKLFTTQKFSWCQPRKIASGNCNSARGTESERETRGS